MNCVDIGFILHLYQPSFQNEELLKKVAKESYIPLLKLIKSRRDLHVTLNIPLSLLELMHKYGFSDWIDDVEDLYKKERIEVIGSAAYHPILPMVPQKIIEDEILLNEYGLGYFLGSKQDFEGETAFMLKDINGFFPPELAVNETVINVLSSLGYKWVVVSNMAVAKNGDVKNPQNHISSSIYRLNDFSCELVTRDNILSNLLSFKRDLDTSDIISYLKSLENDYVIVAMDGEFFGHHYKDGVTLMDILLDKLRGLSIETKFVSDIVSEYDNVEINSIHESTWSTTTIADRVSSYYPLWFSENNDLQNDMYELESHLLSCADRGDIVCNKIYKDASNTLWGESVSEKIYENMHKFLCSDKYWWLSGKTMPRGEYLYDKMFVTNCMKYVENIISEIGDNPQKDEIVKRYESVMRLLKE